MVFNFLKNNNINIFPCDHQALWMNPLLRDIAIYAGTVSVCANFPRSENFEIRRAYSVPSCGGVLISYRHQLLVRVAKLLW